MVGDDDVQNDTAGVNPRGGEVERDIPISDFIERITSEVAEKTAGPQVVADLTNLQPPSTLLDAYQFCARKDFD